MGSGTVASTAGSQGEEPGGEAKAASTARVRAAESVEPEASNVLLGRIVLSAPCDRQGGGESGKECTAIQMAWRPDLGAWGMGSCLASAPSPSGHLQWPFSHL